ncbi:hypothetical protein F4808DRAFT_288258 [Astrocystis sublimbata]|nr:hypothetical protein F4808DRAFT_288258 [Astrocystis sublimbata]
MSNPGCYLQSLGSLAILPPELRFIIYKFVLVDPPRWQRPHHPSCSYGHEPSTENACSPRRYIPPWEPFCLCQCCLREGTSLLRVSRAIHTEASPVFWSQNLFCFESGNDFARCVGTRLRSEHRGLLRHAYILNDIYPGGIINEQGPDWNKLKPFENTIRQCTGLRTLGINPEVVRPFETPIFDRDSVPVVLAGMISPKIQFSLLDFEIEIDIHLTTNRGIQVTCTRTLTRMPYDLHHKTSAAKTVPRHQRLTCNDSEFVHKQRCLIG